MLKFVAKHITITAPIFPRVRFPSLDGQDTIDQLLHRTEGHMNTWTHEHKMADADGCSWGSVFVMCRHTRRLRCSRVDMLVWETSLQKGLDAHLAFSGRWATSTLKITRQRMFAILEWFYCFTSYAYRTARYINLGLMRIIQRDRPQLWTNLASTKKRKLSM